MPAPIAFFLTWTCYGTWLHGDDRGSVDASHNQFATPLLAPSVKRLAIDQARLKYPPVTLDPAARAIVDQTIRKHVAVRAWRLHACNVRSNHVHVVLDRTGPTSPERVMEQFKAWSTRHLREAQWLSIDHPAWTEHGSTRWLFTPESVALAVDYVLIQK